MYCGNHIQEEVHHHVQVHFTKENVTPQNDTELLSNNEITYTEEVSLPHSNESAQQSGDRSNDKNVSAMTTVRELVVYLIFLAILSILVFGMTSPTMYLFTSAIKSIFIDAPFGDQGTTFTTMTTDEDFWQFAEKVLVKGLHWEYWYGEGDSQVTLTDQIDRNILYENKIMGVPRLRQLRVRNDSCTVPTAFSRVIPVCYADYSESSEDRSVIGVANSSTPAWEYFTEKELEGSLFWGKLTYYSGGGFIQLLGRTRNESADIIDTLKQNLWIDRGTRAIFIDFTLYNGNVNLFCIVKLLVEFSPTGRLVPSYSLTTAKFIRYVKPFDFFILACEAVFTLFTIFRTISKLVEMCRTGCSYFKRFWNWIDWTVIILSMVCIGFSLIRYWLVASVLENLIYATELPNFDQLSFWQVIFNQLAALCVFFAWIRIFKYTSISQAMTQMSTTLSRCSADLLGFGVMFFIVFFSFAQLGYLLFGTQIDGYSSFQTAVFTLFRTIMGEFDFPSLQNANRVLGPLYFIAFTFFVFFILLNMFLAIIAETYKAVTEEPESYLSKLELAEYIKGTLGAILSKVTRPADTSIDALAHQHNSSDLSHEDMRHRLKKSGFSDMEIEVFLQNRESNSGPSPSKQQEVAESNGPMSSSSVSAEEFAELHQRVDVIEHSVNSIVDKIDTLLSRLENMDKSKNKRREAMAKILDTITLNDSMDEETKRRQIESLIRAQLDSNGGRP